jgi:hypothetical protein
VHQRESARSPRGIFGYWANDEIRTLVEVEAYGMVVATAMLIWSGAVGVQINV